MTTSKALSKSFPCYLTMMGLLSLLLLSGCQVALTPEQVTTEFWEAMAQGNLESARKYATQETQHLVTKQQNLEDATVKTGAILIDGSNATVATVMTLKNPENTKDLSFDTVLLKKTIYGKSIISERSIIFQTCLSGIFLRACRL